MLRRGNSNVNALAAAAAWLAYMAGLFAGRAANDVPSFAIGAVTAAALVLFGYAAASHTRVMAPHDITNRMRLAALAFAAGVGLGLANLAANWLIASADPALRDLLGRRFVTMDPVVAVVAAPLQEEITFRLFLLSVLAWGASQLTKKRSTVFVSALVVSSVVFAVLHLARPVPPDPALANFYRAALVVKYTLAGLPLGWIFWRWGLPYAILCHAASNAAHIVAEDVAF